MLWRIHLGSPPRLVPSPRGAGAFLFVHLANFLSTPFTGSSYLCYSIFRAENDGSSGTARQKGRRKETEMNYEQAPRTFDELEATGATSYIDQLGPVNVYFKKVGLTWTADYGHDQLPPLVEGAPTLWAAVVAAQEKNRKTWPPGLSR